MRALYRANGYTTDPSIDPFVDQIARQYRHFYISSCCCCCFFVGQSDHYTSRAFIRVKARRSAHESRRASSSNTTRISQCYVRLTSRRSVEWDAAFSTRCDLVLRFFHLVRRQDSTSHAGTRRLATLRTNRDQMLRDKRLIPG